MLVLSVDTTSVRGSVAILDDEALVASAGFVTKLPRHAENLLPQVDYLLSELGVKLRDVNAFAVGSGPGSFVGIRIGIASVLGFAYSCGRPAVGVSVLDATAYNYRHFNGDVCVMLDAYRGEVYGACYRCDGQASICVTEPVCMTPQRFVDKLPKMPGLLVGSGSVTHRKVLKPILSENVVFTESNPFLAESVGRIAALRIEKGEVDDPKAIYIRSSEVSA